MENQDDIEVIKETISFTLKSEGIDTFQVYLFGSRARGDFSPHSDYDILIVSKKKLRIKEKIKLYNVDIIIKSSDEVNYYKNKIGHIVRSALKEGILI
jgi:predicted nucleotidyltransferase